MFLTQKEINDTINRAKTRITELLEDSALANSYGSYEQADRLLRLAIDLQSVVDALEANSAIWTEEQKTNAVQYLHARGELINITELYDYVSCTGEQQTTNTFVVDHLTNVLNVGQYTHVEIDTHINDKANPHETKISNLDDVTLTSVAEGESLVYRSGVWVNETVSIDVLNNNTPLPKQPAINFFNGIEAVDGSGQTDVSLASIPANSLMGNAVSSTGIPQGIAVDPDSFLGRLSGDIVNIKIAFDLNSPDNVSVPTTAAVASLVAGSLLAENGLSKVSNVIELGGPMTKNTTVLGNGFTYSFITGTTPGVYASGLYLNNDSSVELRSGNVATSDKVAWAMTSTSATLTVTDNAATVMSFAFGADATFTDSRVVKKGIEYDAGVTGADFTAQSLVTKAYVDGLVSGTVTASNGLNIVGTDVRLGGALGASTTITTGVAFFNIVRDGLPYTTTFNINGITDNITLKTGDNSLNNETSLFMFTTGMEIRGTVSNTVRYSLAFDSVSGATYTDTFASPTGIKYGSDYSSTFDALSLVHKSYVDARIVGRAISPTLAAPTVSQNNYAIVWDNTNNRFNLALISGGGGGTVTSVGTSNGIGVGGIADASIVSSGILGLVGQALAFHNLGTNGIVARTGAGAVSARTITAGTNISVTNGDGVSGNPTIGFTGTLGIANGGTNATSFTANRVVITSAGTSLTTSNDITFNGTEFTLFTNDLIVGNNKVRINTTVEQSQALYVTGDILATGTISGSSDIRLKNNIRDIKEGLSTIKKLAPKLFYKRGVQTELAGFIAQETYEVLPQAVHKPHSDQLYWGMNDTAIVAYLVKAVQELEQKLNDLTNAN